MKVLVLQHVAVEHPGILRDYFRADGITLDTVDLDQGERIPQLDRFDVMLVMGGPQDVWQEAEYPWLVAEKAAIREFVVKMQRPYLGICLGHQLLAEAIGGKVGLAEKPEVGVMSVDITAAGRADPLFHGVPHPLTVLQWHSAEVKNLPANTQVLASSGLCGVQAFRYGAHAYGLQCHVETTKDTVSDWAAIPEYASSLETVLGKGAMHALRTGVTEKLAGFNRDARVIYENFMSIIGTSSPDRAEKRASV